jgi:flagellar assembly protein FliH
MQTDLIRAEQVKVENDTYLETLTVTECRQQERMPDVNARLKTVSAVYRRKIQTVQDKRLQIEEELAELRLQQSLAEANARKEGYAKGLEQGRKDTRNELAGEFEHLSLMAEEFRTAAGLYHGKADTELIKLAVWIAERILLREVKEGLPLLLRTINELLDNWQQEELYRFRLNPEDRRLLFKHPELEQLKEKVSGKIEFIESPEIPHLSCRLELTSGIVDATPKEMLKYIEAQLISNISTSTSDRKDDIEDEDKGKQTND